ncbi:hypothetical protein BHM03_00054970 [Ensete ventricosum]|nr:hypothetical protein BHM03_00054970 [Ensete ventricosum]
MNQDDKEGIRTVDDDNFIDDSGVDPADRYGSDNEPVFAGDAPQVKEGEEDDEIKQLFKGGKKKKRNEKSPAEIALIVEHLMAEQVAKATGLQSRDDDIDLAEFSHCSVCSLKCSPCECRGRKSGNAASRQHASRPEALPLDFVVRPQSKVDPEEVRARAKQVVQDQRRLKVSNLVSETFGLC